MKKIQKIEGGFLVRVGQYILYSKVSELRPKYYKRIFFFSKSEPKKDWEEAKAIPEGYCVILSPNTNLPMLAHASSSQKLPSKDRQGI